MRGPGGDVRYHVLGELSAVRDGRALELGGRKQRVLLAALLAERGRSVPVGRLLDLLWDEEPPPQAEAGIQSYVSRLRRVLEPDRTAGAAPEVLVSRGGGYALLVDDDAVDAGAFAALAAQAGDAGRGERWQEAGTLARRALQLWRGPFLPELADLPFAVAEGRRLDALHRGCREALIVASLGSGHVTDAVAEAEDWVEQAADDERALWLLLVALHRAGRTCEALERLRSHRESLVERTGLEVGRELEQLQARLLAQDPALDRWPVASAGSPEHAHATPPMPVIAKPGSSSTGSSGAGTSPAGTSTGTPDTSAPPVPAQRAVSPSAARPPSPVLGRQAEIAVLGEACAAAEDRSAWVVLSGPAGIGKTSLADTAARRAAAAVWSRCPDDTVPAWWPLRQVVRSLGGAPDALFVPPAGADADAARFALYERVAAALLAARPADGVLAVVVDDVQWADESSLACLAHLADALADPRLLWVLTLRDDEQPQPPLQRLLATLARTQRTWHVPVPPLTASAVGEVLARLTGESVEPADAALLALRTGGNPLFVGEYARLPQDERRSGTVPTAARQLLERRLAKLPEPVVEVLRTAAVVGEDFDLPTVAAAAGLTVAQLAERLDTAVAAHVVVADRAGGTAYGFAHALLRDAVLTTLTAPRRQLLHAQVAGVLAGRQDPERLARRAGHLLAAGPVADPDEVRAACAAVARDAARRSEHADAAQWWESALAVQPQGDDRLSLELEAVRALARSGRPDRALQRVDEAFGCALDAGDLGSAALLADELVHVQDGWMWTVFGEPRPPLLDRLIEALELTDEPACRVPLLGAVGAGLHLFTPVEQRLPYAEQALTLARATGDPDLLRGAQAAALRSLTQVPAEVDRAWALMEDLERGLGTLRDRSSVLVLQTRADLLFLQGQIRASYEAHLRTVALSDALRLPGYRAQERWGATRYAQWSGDGELAERLVQHARHLHERTGVQYAAGAYAQSILSLRWHQGRTAEVDEALVALTRGFNLELWQAVRAHERGEPAVARTWLDRVPEERCDWWGRPANLVLHAHVVCDLALAERAEPLLDALRPHAGRVVMFGHFGCAGPVDLALGRLLALLGRRDEAAARLRAAHELAVREGGRPFAQQASRLLAELGHEAAVASAR